MTHVDPEAFTCALHFFLGQLVPRLEFASPSSSFDLKCSTASTPNPTATPISEFIKRMLDTVSPSDISRVDSVTKLSAGTVPITMAICMLMTKVKGVPCQDVTTKRSASSLTLSPQKFDDYRISLLPLSALSQCLENPEPSGRIGALRVLIGLTALHPLHANQIGNNVEIMNFLLLSAHRRLSPEEVDQLPDRFKLSHSQEPAVAEHSDAEDAFIFRLLTDLSDRDADVHEHAASTLSLKSLLNEFTRRMSLDDTQLEGVTDTSTSMFWSVPTLMKGPHRSQLGMDELTGAIIGLCTSLCSNTAFTEDEAVTGAVRVLNNFTLTNMREAVSTISDASWDGSQESLTILTNCNHLIQKVQCLHFHLKSSSAMLREFEVIKGQVALLLYQKENYEEGSALPLDHLRDMLISEVPKKAPKAGSGSLVYELDILCPLFTNFCGFIENPFELQRGSSRRDLWEDKRDTLRSARNALQETSSKSFRDPPEVSLSVTKKRATFSRMGPNGTRVIPSSRALPGTSDEILSLGGKLLSDWCVSWPSLPSMLISIKISYMLYVSRSPLSCVGDFLGFLGRDKDNESSINLSNSRLSIGTEYESFIMAQRLSHSLAAILIGGKVTIHVPIELIRTGEADEDVPKLYQEHAEEDLGCESSSSDYFDDLKLSSHPSDEILRDLDQAEIRTKGPKGGAALKDKGILTEKGKERHSTGLSSSLTSRRPKVPAINLNSQSSMSVPERRRSMGSIGHSRYSDKEGDDRPASLRLFRRTLYATKIVEQSYSAETRRCSKSLLSVISLLNDVVIAMDAMTSGPGSRSLLSEIGNDRTFDYSPAAKRLVEVLSCPVIEDGDDGRDSNYSLCVASIDCLTALCNHGIDKCDSFLPGASAHHLNPKMVTTSPIHSIVIANISCITSQIERLGSRILGPSLRLISAVSSTLKLSVLKEEASCSALVRLVVQGLKSGLYRSRADSCAGDACGLIVLIGRSHPDTVKAVLSRNEVEDALLDLIISLAQACALPPVPCHDEAQSKSSDLECLCLALQAMTVLADCFNSSPFYIFDPSWSVLSMERRLMGWFDEDDEDDEDKYSDVENLSEGRGEYGASGVHSLSGAQVLAHIMKTCCPVLTDLKGWQCNTLIILMNTYNCASSLLQSELRTKQTKAQTIMKVMKEELTTALMPFLSVALEPAFLTNLKASGGNSSSCMGLEPSMSKGVEEAAALLVGSALHFISSLILCDVTVATLRGASSSPRLSLAPHIPSVCDSFSEIEAPSWADGKPFKDLFRSKMLSYEEWCGATRDGHTATQNLPVLAPTDPSSAPLSALKLDDVSVRERNIKRSRSLLQLILHIMDVSSSPEKDDVFSFGSADSTRSSGWARDNQVVQLRGIEVLSCLAMSGVDLCESEVLPRPDSQTKNTAALTLSLRSNSVTDSDGELTPRRRSTLKIGSRGFSRGFPVMGSERALGVAPIPRALSALNSALTAGNGNSNLNSSMGHKEKLGPLGLTARGVRLRRAFVTALKAIILTSEGVGCDVIVQSEAHKWLFLFLRSEAEIASPKPASKSRKSSTTVGPNAAFELCRPVDRDEACLQAYGEEPLTSASCTAALCCQVLSLLASAGFANSLCLSGLCEAVLSLMTAHSHILRIQFEGLSALVEMLSGAPEHLSRLNGTATANPSIFDDEPPHRNPFASKNPSAPPSARAIAQQAVDLICDALDNAVPMEVETAAVEERKKQLRQLILRHKKLGLDQESCSIS